MDEKQIIFETKKLIEDAYTLMEDYDDKSARRIVKKTFQLEKLIHKLISEAKISESISNIAVNDKTKKRFGIYVSNLTIISEMFSNYTKYKPKTAKGFYIFIKDITNYSNKLYNIKEK